MTSVSNFVSEQNASGGGRGANGVGLEFDDSGGGAVPSGDNAVIGLQNANFTSGYNAMVLDNPVYDYAVTVDGTGAVTVTDLLANATVTATGLSYLVFDGNGSDGSFQTGTGAYSQIYVIGDTTHNEIAAIYQAALSRQPDLPGLEYWEAQFNAHAVSMNDIAYDFINSKEFLTDFSSASAILTQVNTTNATAFVDQLYENVLGRAADAAGAAYWIGVLTSNEATPSQVLADFAISSENLANITVNNSLTGSGYVVDTSTGGIANPLLPLATVAPIAVEIGYLNLDLVSDATSLVAGTTYATGISTNSSGILTVSASNMTVSSSSLTIDVTGSNDTITFAGTVNSQQDVAGGFINGQNDTVTLSGIGNVIKVTIDPTHTAPSMTITGWNVGQDQLVFYGPASGSSPETGITGGGPATGPIFAAPAAGTTVTWTDISTPSSGSYVGNSLPGVVYVGNVGGGSAAEVATAANLVYKVADASSAPPEQVIFIGQDNAGDAVIEYWGQGPNVSTNLPGTADTNGNHLVDASEFTARVVLTGVTAANLTAADIL